MRPYCYLNSNLLRVITYNSFSWFCLVNSDWSSWLAFLRFCCFHSDYSRPLALPNCPKENFELPSLCDTFCYMNHEWHKKRQKKKKKLRKEWLQCRETFSIGFHPYSELLHLKRAVEKNMLGKSGLRRLMGPGNFFKRRNGYSG